MKNFLGRVAVVTGGANGIGFALARRFLGEGVKVVIADINADELERARVDLSAFGDVLAYRTDVASYDQVEALAAKAVEHFGAVHILCNNAGVGGFQKFETTSLPMWEWTLGVDLWGPIYGCKAFLPILKAQDEAHILNTASMAAFMYAPFNQPYNVSKAGVAALSEGLQRELAITAPHVGISVLCPAYVATTIHDDERNAPASHVRRADADPEMQPIREHVSRSLNEGKNPSDIAELCLNGIREGRFYLFSHPKWLGVVADRAEYIMSGNIGLPALTEYD